MRSAARVDARELLRDSWMTDGRRGWFVDGAASADRSPFSLYETAWRLRLAALNPGRPAVDPERLRLWARPAERGRSDSSGLPPVAQIDLAVDALLTAGGTADRADVGRALEALRQGGGYRTAPSAARTDPGSTAVAVRVLTRLGLPVPAPVRQADAAALERLSAREAATAPGEVVPVLQTAALLGVTGADRTRAAALATAAARALSAYPVEPVRLAWEGVLRDAAPRLGARLPAFPAAACDGHVLPDGGIGLPGARQGDPQATYWALRLGCSAVRVPAAGAHSRAGWPAGQTGQTALSATAAALALARGTGRSAEFAGPLARQVREVWLPRERRPAPYDTARLVDRVDLRLVARALGGALAREVDRGLPAPSVRGVRAADDARLLLTALDAGDSPAARRTVCATGSPLRAAPAAGGGASIVRATRLAAVADLCHDPALARRARAEAAAVRAGTALYRSGTALSFEASVMGTWIERPRADVVTAWTRAGLCTGDLCAETPARLPTADHTPLRTLAALMAARAGDLGALFPVAF